MTLGNLKVGDRASVTRIYNDASLNGFHRLTGIRPSCVPEPLIAGLFSFLLGVRLPGPGTNYLKQDLEFLARAPVNEKLEASVEITRLRPDKHLIDLEAVCRTSSGETICHGRSLVLARDVGV